MARLSKLVINKNFAEKTRKEVDFKTEKLLNIISKIGIKLSDAKTVYDSNNSSGEDMVDISETINRITSSYQELNQRFSNALKEIVEEYSKVDAQTESNINSKTAAPLTIEGIKGVLDSIFPKGGQNSEKINEDKKSSALKDGDTKNLVSSTRDLFMTRGCGVVATASVSFSDDDDEFEFFKSRMLEGPHSSIKNHNVPKNCGDLLKPGETYELEFFDNSDEDVAVKSNGKVIGYVRKRTVDSMYDYGEINKAYKIGLGETYNNKEFLDKLARSQGKKTPCEIYFGENVSKEERMAFEQGIRDASVDKFMADTLIERGIHDASNYKKNADNLIKDVNNE